MLGFLPALSPILACGATGSSGPTTLAITNKISSLGAGKTYVFDIAEDHDQGVILCVAGLDQTHRPT